MTTGAGAAQTRMSDSVRRKLSPLPASSTGSCAEDLCDGGGTILPSPSHAVDQLSLGSRPHCVLDSQHLRLPLELLKGC